MSIADLKNYNMIIRQKGIIVIMQINANDKQEWQATSFHFSRLRLPRRTFPSLWNNIVHAD